MLSKFSVRKPFTVLVAVVICLVLGFLSFQNMSTDFLPNMEFPYALVMTCLLYTSIDAKVVVSGSEVRLMFGSNSIKLPENKAKKLIDNGYEDKTVTFGIRPEDIKDEEMFISNSPDTTLEATVKVYEMLGAEVFLYFTVETFDITVRVNPRTTARPGDTIKIALDGSKIHLFDKETQETITN